MDQSRRVVASADEHGRTAFMFDGPAARSLSWTDGGPTALEWIWASESTPTIPHDKGDPTLELTTLFPQHRAAGFLSRRFRLASAARTTKRQRLRRTLTGWPVSVSPLMGRATQCITRCTLLRRLITAQLSRAGLILSCHQATR